MARPQGNADHGNSDLGYVKMHGAGNDFVMIDGRKLGEVPADRLQKLAALLCDRRRGLGADGIVVLYPAASGAAGTDFEMRYVNASGLPGEMCGNGARCAAFFAGEIGLAGTEDRLPDRCRHGAGGDRRQLGHHRDPAPGGDRARPHPRSGSAEGDGP